MRAKIYLYPGLPNSAVRQIETNTQRKAMVVADKIRLFTQQECFALDAHNDYVKRVHAGVPIRTYSNRIAERLMKTFLGTRVTTPEDAA